MPRWLSLTILITSPVAITIGLVLLGLFLNALSGLWGTRKPPGPIVVAMLGLGMLHAGYFLGPWFFLSQRTTLALWLMIPIAIGAMVVGIVIVGRLAASSGGPDGMSTAQLGRLAALGAGLIAYGGPIVVMWTNRAP